jgi:hypothetical protein
MAEGLQRRNDSLGYEKGTPSRFDAPRQPLFAVGDGQLFLRLKEVPVGQGLTLSELRCR